jgi:hypothetical protein
VTTTTPEVSRPARPGALAGIALCGVLASGLLGGTTNAVNGLVSPAYFVTILGWQGVEDVWRASIAQGVFEGLLFGVFFSLAFSVATGIMTGVGCTFGFAFQHLLGILGGAYLCWAFGGLVAMGLATLSPEFYRRAFIGVPAEQGAMLRYAWVGGSIWGAELGGLVCLVIGQVVLRANWRRQVSVGGGPGQLTSCSQAYPDPTALPSPAPPTSCTEQPRRSGHGGRVEGREKT